MAMKTWILKNFGKKKIKKLENFSLSPAFNTRKKVTVKIYVKIYV